MNSVGDIWSSILELLKENLTPVAINTWFDECRIVNITENKIILLVPSDFKRGVIESRFIGQLKDAVRQIFAGDMDIQLVSGAESEVIEKQASDDGDMIDSDEYTFDKFVVGPSNKFAHAAAMAVAEGQTKAFNPLFIYGESGLGKTHLLYAIRHEVRKRHPEYNIVFVRGNDFMNELISAIQAGRNVDFREKYRSADLFLMDDIQIIAGKNSTQEEFFHTFNTLHEAQKQIVFTSDRPPSEMTLLADRLRTRFESGLLADIQPPDYETRTAIIKNKSIQLGLVLPDDVVNYIATNMTSNVRQLEGAVKKIRAYRDMMDDNISVTSVANALKALFKEKTAYVPTPDDIIEETAKYFNISPEDIRGQRRTRNTATARQIAMYQIRILTTLSLQDIGNFFEGRDHTTVLASIQKIEKSIASSPEFAQMVKDITANINSRN
ncbi:MAG: chromosomal replication initiator protein DnaA [Oscillospiraceae bacterium]